MTHNNSIKYRSANKDDIELIVNVHIRCFPHNFSTLLGKKILTAYYYEYLKSDSLFVVAFDNEKLIGFCMGYDRTNSVARRTFVRKNRMRILMRSLFLCLTFNRTAISKCWSYIFKKNHSVDKEKTNIAKGDLLSICVLPDYRGKGISHSMVHSFEQLLLNKGIHNYILTVYKDNKAATKFYEKIGMTPCFENKKEICFVKEIQL